MAEQVRFCAAPDGVRIAFATHGDGPALVRVATWLTHLEYDGQIYRHWLTELAADHTMVRYDMRGMGLSDRDVRDFSLDARVSDLEAVVDAAGLERFALLGLSGGGPIAVAYAVRHPARVSHLVLYGTYARGRAMRGRSARQEEDRLLVDLTRVGWGRSNPAFRQVFTTLYMPDASPAEVAAFDELQRVSAAPDAAAGLREASYGLDVSELARRVVVPTLVMHVRDDAIAPFEEGRRIAGLIPGARFIPLAGRNHIFLGPDDPAWSEFVAGIRRFLAEDHPAAPSVPPPGLTARERAVVGLVAEGLDNQQIARRLRLSVRTVERHLSNVYTKLGVSGKAARAAAAVRFTGHG